MSLPTHLAAALVARTRPATAYAARLASSEADLRAAQALRFEVFNLKLDEGLVHSHDTVLDVDPFDTQCDHILVEDLADGRVVGTYRLQTGCKPAWATTANASSTSRRWSRPARRLWTSDAPASTCSTATSPC